MSTTGATAEVGAHRRGLPAGLRWIWGFLTIAIVVVVSPLIERPEAALAEDRSLRLSVFTLVRRQASSTRDLRRAAIRRCSHPQLRLGDFQVALSGFGFEFIWLLATTFVLLEGRESSGLDRRIALGV